VNQGWTQVKHTTVGQLMGQTHSVCLECEQGLDRGKTYDGGSAHVMYEYVCVWSVSKGWTQVKHIGMGQLSGRTHVSGV
jgi:hypothetical protein